MENVLLKISELGPIVSLLIAAIIYFLKREKEKEKIIAKLQTELRESERENLTALYKLMTLVEKLESEKNSNNEILLNELINMRNSIEDKLNDIKYGK